MGLSGPLSLHSVSKRDNSVIRGRAGGQMASADYHRTVPLSRYRVGGVYLLCSFEMLDPDKSDFALILICAWASLMNGVAPCQALTFSIPFSAAR